MCCERTALCNIYDATIGLARCSSPSRVGAQNDATHQAARATRSLIRECLSARAPYSRWRSLTSRTAASHGDRRASSKFYPDGKFKVCVNGDGDFVEEYSKTDKGVDGRAGAVECSMARGGFRG